ncbi:hypothetical protein B2G74_33320 [Burkholderia sp. A27]|nr:hypothetical protein B2G74_33320 [Burkholderia sp. A27]
MLLAAPLDIGGVRMMQFDAPASGFSGRLLPRYPNLVAFGKDPFNQMKSATPDDVDRMSRLNWSPAKPVCKCAQRPRDFFGIDVLLWFLL